MGGTRTTSAVGGIKNRARKNSGGAAGGGAAPERLSASGGNSDEARPAKRGERGANALTIFFEMSSNFFENVHSSSKISQGSHLLVYFFLAQDLQF